MSKLNGGLRQGAPGPLDATHLGLYNLFAAGGKTTVAQPPHLFGARLTGGILYSLGGRMSALPANNTNRLFFDYVSQTNGYEHTMAVRYGPSQSVAAVMASLYSFVSAIGLAHFASGWRFIRARRQDAGSDFSVPEALAAPLSTWVGTGGTFAISYEPLELCFVGRSPTSGRKARLSLYGGTGVNLNTNFRVELPDSGYAWLQAGIAALNGASNAFLAVDGSPVVWYPYVNWQFNSYWERQVRGQG